MCHECLVERVNNPGRVRGRGGQGNRTVTRCDTLDPGVTIASIHHLAQDGIGQSRGTLSHDVTGERDRLADSRMRRDAHGEYLMAAERDLVLGRATASPSGDFPLLVKLLAQVFVGVSFLLQLSCEG